MESQQLEFKREYTESVKLTLLAFANTDGGRLLIGVEDNGTEVGVEKPKGIIEQVMNSLRESIQPDLTMLVSPRIESKNGIDIVVFDVKEGIAKPYYLTKKGISSAGVYIRQGASTVQSSDQAILMMIRETGGFSYEREVSPNQELTFSSAEQFFKKKDLKFGKSQKQSLGLINQDGLYTKLALLLSDQAEHTIKYAAFKGTKRIDFLDRKEIGGSVFEQFEEVMIQLERFNRTRSEIPGLYRIDIRDYPTEAIREGVLNAIIHRDYYHQASTLVSLLDDRIEISSVGGLYGGVTKDDLFLGSSRLRNPGLAAIFYRLELIEAYGTGIPKIFEFYHDQAEQPVIDTAPNTFRLTLPNVNYGHGKHEVTVEQPVTRYHVESFDRVVALFKGHETLTRKDIQLALGISQASAINLLREWVNAGILLVIGQGRNTRYRLK